MLKLLEFLNEVLCMKTGPHRGRRHLYHVFGVGLIDLCEKHAAEETREKHIQPDMDYHRKQNTV